MKGKKTLKETSGAETFSCPQDGPHLGTVLVPQNLSRKEMREVLLPHAM